MRQSPDAHRGGPEALVAQRQAAERRQQRRRVPLHGDVELRRRHAAQQVADRAADQVHAAARRGAASSSAAPHGMASQGVAQIGHRERTIYHQVAMSPRRRKRLWWLVAGAVVALLLAGAAAAVVVMRSGEGDVSNPDVAFEDTTESVPVAPDPVEPPVEEPASRRVIRPTTASAGRSTATRSRGRTTSRCAPRCDRRSARRGRSPAGCCWSSRP